MVGRSRVVLVRHGNVLDDRHTPDQAIVDKMLHRAISSMSGENDPIVAWKNYIKPSDTVGIKTNMSRMATHVEVVKAIVKNLHSIGVKDHRIIIWDRNKASIGYEGLEALEKKRRDVGAGNKLITKIFSYIFSEKKAPRFGYRNNISRIITDHCTALINVPGTRVHWLAGIGIALKNWVGAVSNINAEDLYVSFPIHKDSCAEVCSINAIPVIRDKCRLVVVDALRPLFHGGPQVDPRYLWHNNALLMSTDPVAVDTVCLRMLQDKRNEFRGREWPINPPAKHVFVADKKYGLGNSDWDKIELIDHAL